MQCCPLGSRCSVRAPRARRDKHPLVLEWRLSVRAWAFFSQPAWKNGDTANELPSSESATDRERERDFNLTFRLTIKEHEKKTSGHDRTRAIIISQNSKCLHVLFYFTGHNPAMSHCNTRSPSGPFPPAMHLRSVFFAAGATCWADEID